MISISKSSAIGKMLKFSVLMFILFPVLTFIIIIMGGTKQNIQYKISRLDDKRN